MRGSCVAGHRMILTAVRTRAQSTGGGPEAGGPRPEAQRRKPRAGSWPKAQISAPGSSSEASKEGWRGAKCGAVNFLALALALALAPAAAAAPRARASGFELASGSASLSYSSSPAGPISPNRGVRRGPQRLGGGVTLRSKTANPQ
jgi:hypothetical protein